eukprot:GHRR01030779.1.p2 GENE.GHRR01030779.1~~GHRR01030779.1.p2  ORF type:complete len:121 (-),score=25.89 GHRR01030779.1:326-688(-)
MVRRAAAQKLGQFAAVMERDAVSRDLLPLFTDLTSDGECAIHICCYWVAAAVVVARSSGDLPALCQPAVLCCTYMPACRHQEWFGHLLVISSKQKLHKTIASAVRCHMCSGTSASLCWVH